MSDIHMNRRNLMGAFAAISSSSQLSAGRAPSEPPEVQTAKARGALSPITFGADPLGQQDSLGAIVAARDEALKSGRLLLFPEGNYKIGATLDLGFPRLHVQGEGRVVLQAAFDGGHVVSVDGGLDNIIYQSSLSNLTIRGNGSPGQSGLRVRNAVHGYRADLRVRNITARAFNVESDVFSTYERLVSDAQNDGDDREAKPKIDLYVGRTEAFGSTTSCTFRDCIFEEGTDFGVHLAAADNCLFEGGGAEGLSGWGVRISENSRRNVFLNFYCEQNRAGDFDIGGLRNLFVNCEAYDRNRKTVQFKVRGGALGNIIEKCGGFSGDTALTTIEIDAGAQATVLRDCDLHRLTDHGEGTLIDNCGDAFGGAAISAARSFGNVSRANPHLLDWYEEGQFEPRFSGTESRGAVSHENAFGEFQRIGNQVHFSLGLRVSTIGTAPKGALIIERLPYKAAPASLARAVAVGGVDNIAFGGAVVQVFAAISGEAIKLLTLGSGGQARPLDASQLRAGSAITVSGHYPVD